MKNGITDLRNHLFATIEALTDPDNPMDIGRAKAVSDLAQTIINSAKLELEFRDKIGGLGTGFIPEDRQPSANPNLRALEGGRK
jgi:hypothetical protein